VPEISAALKCERKPALELEQKRALPIGSQAKAQMWQIPVCIAYQAGGAVHRQCSVVADAKAEMELADAQTCPAWLLLNDGEAGYYQVAYQDDLLKKVLADGASHLSVAERVGVLGDVDLLVSAGEARAGTALALVPEFSNDPAAQVVEAAADIAALLKSKSVPGDLREKGARFIRDEFGGRAM